MTSQRLSASLPPARLARSLASRQRGRLVDEIYRRALEHALGEIERVPVRQPDAAVRVGLADPLRIRRAVDAVAVLGEIDPDQSHGIVRAGRDRELAFGMDALELEFGIVMVGGVVGDPTDLVSDARRRLFLAADRTRVERGGLAVLAHRAEESRLF